MRSGCAPRLRFSGFIENGLRSALELAKDRDTLLHMSKASSDSGNDPVRIPIENEIDLHTFNPRDLGQLVPAYLEACRDRGVLQVRIVHGKGIGNVCRSVRAILGRIPEVKSFGPASEHFGGLGATIVNLHPKP